VCFRYSSRLQRYRQNLRSPNLIALYCNWVMYVRFNYNSFMFGVAKGAVESRCESCAIIEGGFSIGFDDICISFAFSSGN